MMPAISVLVPLYNVEKHVERCLESIAAQTFTNFEVILVEDCSTDDTSQRVMEFIATHPNLNAKIFHHECNLGLLMARRTGYINANGKYFMFVDSDDYLPVDALEVLYKNIIEYDADILVGAFNIINGEDVKVRKRGPSGSYNRNQIIEMLMHHKLTHCVCGGVYKRELFEHCDHLPSIEGQTNSEDMMLTYSLIPEINKLAIISTPVYNYFYNNQSSSKKKFSDLQFSQIIRATNYIEQILLKVYPYRKTIYRYISERILSLLSQNCSDKLISQLSNSIQINLKFRKSVTNLPIHKAISLYILRKLPFLRKLTHLYY